MQRRVKFWVIGDGSPSLKEAKITRNLQDEHAMATECVTTANSITEVLLAGDAVLNLTQQPLNTIAGTMFVSSDKNAASLESRPCSFHWSNKAIQEIGVLLSDSALRIVVVSEEGCCDADRLVRELVAQRIPHLHCTLINPCDEDDFMDEQDAEAVSERLRQLGYL